MTFRICALLIAPCLLPGMPLLPAAPLEGTSALGIEGDLASQMIDGADKFLLHQIARAEAERERQWNRDLSSPAAYARSIESNRQLLAHIVGVRDERKPFEAPELVATIEQPALIGRGPGYEIFAIRWPVFDDLQAEGLLLVPTNRQPVADVVAVPDADQTPEQLVGLAGGIELESQFARQLAASGCRVVVPQLINRNLGDVKIVGNDRGKGISNREFLYRSAYELGRGIGGYEIQELLAIVDWMARSSRQPAAIGICGYGEGGRLAMLAAALDFRLQATCVSGYFDVRSRVWQEPIDRNVFGLLQCFGDAELAAMIAPRTLIVEACRAPEIVLSGEGGGAPATIVTPPLPDVRSELARARRLVATLEPRFDLIVSAEGRGPPGTSAALRLLLKALAPNAELLADSRLPESLGAGSAAAARHARWMHEIVNHNEQLLLVSAEVRDRFMNRLDTTTPEAFDRTREQYRRIFAEEVIGQFAEPLLAPHPRTRLLEQSATWTRYEVVLDVFPDLIAYGLLTLPNDIAPGETRPVVVCQHGLEGRPQDVIGEQNSQYYAAFATRLAERGYITFAPQNPYLFKDRFRTLQRKANTIKKTLFSLIVPQHQQITDWLKTLPQVDGRHIAFYGLSYGGKSAMRIAPLVDNYCLSICSADFNEWVSKVASTRLPFGYLWTGEYEICEFDLGSTFNYAEMAMLIAPRPFMVERGHHDGVSVDELVAFEFAKVFRFYDTRLHLPERCAIEWFDGPHKINGVGTFEFLDKHLKSRQ